MEMINKEFEIKYYERTEKYLVRAIGDGYLQYNENTGAVMAIPEPKRATYVTNEKDVEELIKWYLEGTPCKTNVCTYAMVAGDEERTSWS